MTERAPFHGSIINLYRDNGLEVGPDGVALSLPYCCHEAGDCWRGYKIPDKNDCCNQLARPFIGPGYAPGSVVFVGQNLYDFGGWDALVGLFDQVCAALAKGAKRMNFGNAKYHGTLVYHRVAVYARVLQMGRVPDDLFSSHQGLVDALRNIAFVNAIKCSPHGHRSRPLNDMPRRCLTRWTSRELEVLSPGTICCLYKPAHDYLNGAYYGGGAVVTRGKLVSVLLGGAMKNVRCIYIPHPAAPGGSSRALTTALGDIQCQSCPLS